MRPHTPLSAVVLLLSALPVNSQCLLSGQYASTPAATYNCAFDLVTWNVQSWDFVINGNQLTVSPSPPGTLPAQLAGTIDCQSGAFSASATILAGPGGCSETYTLTGQVQSVATWTGSFLAQYVGGGCDPAGCTSHSIALAGGLPPTGVRPGERPPGIASLDVGPNPFGDATTLRVQLDNPEFARLTVHDVLGRVIATVLAGQELGLGEHLYHWDRRNRSGERVPAGIYFVRLQAGAAEQVAKLVVLD